MADLIKGIPTPPVISSAADPIRYLALTVKVRETKGKNRGPVIDALHNLFGMKPYGLAYCALGVSLGFRAYGLAHKVKTGFPFTASSQYIRRHFEARGLMSWNASDLLKWHGAVGGWTNSDRAHGHVFLVTGRLTDSYGKVVGIRTLEANSDLAGDRDGDGFYALTRRLASNGLWYVEDAHGKLVGTGKRIWFCNCSAIPGGSWWS